MEITYVPPSVQLILHYLHPINLTSLSPLSPVTSLPHLPTLPSLPSPPSPPSPLSLPLSLSLPLPSLSWLLGTLAMSAALLRTTLRYELFVYTHFFMAMFLILAFLHSFQSWLVSVLFMAIY